MRATESADSGQLISALARAAFIDPGGSGASMSTAGTVKYTQECLKWLQQGPQAWPSSMSAGTADLSPEGSMSVVITEACCRNSLRFSSGTPHPKLAGLRQHK